MAEKKMLVQYIRRGWKGRRMIKNGVEFIQSHRGPRIGVMVALDDQHFGWSLVHTKGENREHPKDVSWQKGVSMAVDRARGNDNKVPDSIKQTYARFCENAIKYFNGSEKVSG